MQQQLERQRVEWATSDEAAEIAAEAYAYAYPLVIMDATWDSMTQQGLPANVIRHATTFPDASFTDVVRPNADTLYSMLLYDVREEPLVVSVPDSGGRYFLLPILDMWTDIFASPGSRTTGGGEQTFAIVASGWRGELPEGVDKLVAPTARGWLIGRTQTNGRAEYDAVHRFQQGLHSAPLSMWQQGRSLPSVSSELKSSGTTPPVEVVAKMSAEGFFGRFTQLTRDNPPHANDYPILARMARIGIVPDRDFSTRDLPDHVHKAIEAAPGAAKRHITGGLAKIGSSANGWRMPMSPIGTYGTDYWRRAAIAFGGLGANTMEDAVYPSAFEDSEGHPLDSAAHYVVHFERAQVPPVRAFWSLTVYDERQLFADNPLDRYAIGDRDDLSYNADGSLDLHLQRESPGQQREPNWLPLPKSGGFSMNLRLYWPKPEVLDGTWMPPEVRRVDK